MMKNIKEKMMQKLIKIARDFGIKELFLFGSILRDDFNANSDVDIMVSFAEGLDISLFEVNLLQEKLEKIFKRRVDIVEKEALNNPYRKKEILKTARRIYADY
jgi:uncharacterized protein